MTADDLRFLNAFERHLSLIKHLTTRDAIIKKLQAKRCPFEDFTEFFEGNELDKEMRIYFANHPFKQILVKPMYSILNKVMKEVD